MNFISPNATAGAGLTAIVQVLDAESRVFAQLLQDVLDGFQEPFGITAEHRTRAIELLERVIGSIDPVCAADMSLALADLKRTPHRLDPNGQPCGPFGDALSRAIDSFDAALADYVPAASRDAVH